MKKFAVLMMALAAVFVMGTVCSAASVTIDGTTVEVEMGDTLQLPAKDGVAAYVSENFAAYAPGEVEYDASFTELTGLGLGVSLWNGAQVRVGSGTTEDGKISGTDSGIRFIADVSRTNTLAALDGAEIGIALTAEGSDTTVYIPAEKYQNDSKTVFTAAITEISADNFARVYTAYPYVKIDETYYTGSGVSRSPYQVAAGLLHGDEISSETLQSVLNAYVNETGVRLTFADVKGAGAFAAEYDGENFFEIESAEYDADEDIYTVTLSPSGQAAFSDYWRETIRINDDNSAATSQAYMKSGSLTNDGNLKFTFKMPGYTFDQTAGVVIVSTIDTANNTLSGYQSGTLTEFNLADEIEVVGISSDISDVRPGATVMLGFDDDGNVAAIELMAALGGENNTDYTILTSNYGEREAYASTAYKNIVGRYSALSSGRRLKVRFIGDEFTNGDETHTYTFEKSSTKYYVVTMTDDGELESVVGYKISAYSAIADAQDAGSVFFYLRYDDENSVVKEAVLYSFPTTYDFTDGGEYSDPFSYDGDEE